MKPADRNIGREIAYPNGIYYSKQNSHPNELYYPNSFPQQNGFPHPVEFQHSSEFQHPDEFQHPNEFSHPNEFYHKNSSKTFSNHQPPSFNNGSEFFNPNFEVFYPPVTNPKFRPHFQRNTSSFYPGIPMLPYSNYPSFRPNCQSQTPISNPHFHYEEDNQPSPNKNKRRKQYFK